MSRKLLAVTPLLLASTLSNAYNLNIDINELKDDDDDSVVLAIPYAFYNENTEVAAAVAVTTSGVYQPQTAMVFNAFYSTNDTSSVFFAFVDYQVPFLDRLFIDGQAMYANWGETESYQDGNPDFPDERAGSNDSDKDDFILADGTDLHMRMFFKYLLPLGDGAGKPIHTFATQGGLLIEGYEAGGREWNPMTSGRTTVELEPFYRDQNFNDEFDNDFDNITSGLKLALKYDNTDWYINPSYGSKQTISFARDWGAQDDSPTFSAVQFSYSKYIPLALGEKTRQRTLALNVWTSDVPTWNSSHTGDNGEEIFHRAPLFEGSTLGGIDRQRGFGTNRFHDRAAINYSAEYRVTPDWNPAPDIPLINKLPIPWWQWIGFVEVGRVAPSYSMSELHRDMKVTVGAGFRVMLSDLVLRVDAAGSEEGGEVQMYFGHTY